MFALHYMGTDNEIIASVDPSIFFSNYGDVDSNISNANVMVEDTYDQCYD